jgi:hypothetical protein
LAFAVIGGAETVQQQLDETEQRLAALRQRRLPNVAAAPPVVDALANSPMLVLTTGPGAIPQPTIELIGLAHSRNRAAALMSINDSPPEWQGVGETHDGVRLDSVGSSRILVDTPYGPAEVALGERQGEPPSSTPIASAAPVGQTILDKPPAGFRSPPEPKSASAP